MHIEAGIEKLHYESYMAIKLIERLLRKNNINRVLRIAYDFECEDGGYYYPLMKTDTIFVNPDNCYNIRQYKEDDASPENMFYPGYTSDNTIYGTILHEFSHFLCFQVFKNIMEEYKKEFPNKRLYLNSYSNAEIDEEIANLITLYISNPYLLKLISEKHFDFLKRFFKTPRPVSSNTCFQIYQKFPIHVKQELKEKWGIIYNHERKKFEKIEIEISNKKRNEV
jgi:hypothetical protein